MLRFVAKMVKGFWMSFVFWRHVKLDSLGCQPDDSRGIYRQLTELQNSASGSEHDEIVDLCGDRRLPRHDRLLSAGTTVL